MTSFRKKTIFQLLLSAFLFAGVVGCTSSSPGESKNPFSVFQGGKKAAAPKKVEKEFNTVGEFVGAERPNF